MSSSYRDLRVWQNAMDLAVEIYRATDAFPQREQYGLTSQLRRAAVSIPSNIAEGKGRNTNREFVVFLFHARGSLMELETQITLAARLQYLSDEEAAALDQRTKSVGSGLSGLIKAIRSASDKGT